MGQGEGMNHRSLACAALAVVTLSSCTGSSTQLKEVQVAPQPPAQRPKKALVVGLTGKPEVRATFESDMSSRLKALGIEPVKSQGVMPAGAPITEDALRALVKREGVDAVVIARLAGTREEQRVESGAPMAYGGGFYGYYPYASGMVYQPSYLVTEQVVTLETRLFRTAGEGELVWRGVSDTFDPAAPADVIRGANEKTVARMRMDGVL